MAEISTRALRDFLDLLILDIQNKINNLNSDLDIIWSLNEKIKDLEDILYIYFERLQNEQKKDC